MFQQVRVYHGESELAAPLLSNNSLDPWVDANSGPRKVMFAGHFPQALTISGSEERYWQTGAEVRFGEYTFKVAAPCDMEVIHVIRRFPKVAGMGVVLKNPQTIIIYREHETRKIGCLDLRDNCVNHQYFGFEYVKTEHYHKIKEGAFFEKDTPFLISPSVKERGGYAYGTNLSFAFMSHVAGSDDGVMISESALKKMSFDIIETRTASWGQQKFLLNTFGNDKYYKSFPDVGEWIRKDGLLLVSREYDDALAITNIGINDTRIIDHTYDDKLYTRPGDGQVIDIQVFHDNRSLPNGMNDQIERYRGYTDSFYQEILRTYNELSRDYRGSRFETDSYHELIVQSLGRTDFDVGEVVQFMYHKAPIDDWRAEFTIKYHITPDVGSKITGGNGDKGVIVAKMKDEDMPINEFGQRADVVMSIDSPFNRQNSGAMYEPFFNQCTRDVLIAWTDRTGIEKGASEKKIAEEMSANPAVWDGVWNEYIRICQILSPAMYDEYTLPKYDEDKWRAKRFSGIFGKNYECLHIFSPTDRPPIWRQAVKEMWAEFRPNVSPVTYRDYAGKLVTTVEDVHIGHKWFMNLEKISDDYLATNTARPQHLGVLGQSTSADKHAAPVKLQPVKALSEAEVRIILSYCGMQVAADLLDRNNSVPSHREYTHSLVSSDKPTAIERGIDRKKVKLGNNRALKLFKHILECNGYAFEYQRYRDPQLPEGMTRVSHL